MIPFATALTLANQPISNILGVINNKHYINMSTDVFGSELWSYDGPSLELVSDINIGIGSSSPRAGRQHIGKFYFIANDGYNGDEPYVIDDSGCPDHMISAPQRGEICHENCNLLRSVLSNKIGKG